MINRQQQHIKSRNECAKECVDQGIIQILVWITITNNQAITAAAAAEAAVTILIVKGHPWNSSKYCQNLQRKKTYSGIAPS